MRNNGRSGLLLVLLFVWLTGPAGCAGLQRKEPGGSELALGITGRVLVADSSAQPQAYGARPLSTGAVRLGERVELFVTPTRATYIYAINYLGDAASIRLYPRLASRKLAAGQTVRIPEEPSQFLQDGGVPATIRLYVVASAEPLSREQCALLRLDCESDPAAPDSQGRGDDKGADKDSKPPPEERKPIERTPDAGRNPSLPLWRDSARLRPGVGGELLIVPVIVRFE